MKYLLQKAPEKSGGSRYESEYIYFFIDMQKIVHGVAYEDKKKYSFL